MRRYDYNVEPCSPYLIQSEGMNLSYNDKKGKEEIRKLAITLSNFELDVYDCITSSMNHPTSLCDSCLIDDHSFDDSNHDYSSEDGDSIFFRQNYKCIMHGENADWILCGIGLWFDCIKFQYCNCSIKNACDRKRHGGTVYIRQAKNLVKDLKFVAKVPLRQGDTYEKYGLWWAADDWKFRDGTLGNAFTVIETSMQGEHCTLEYYRPEGRRHYLCKIRQGVHTFE
ncbi:MAG: hypothetical protein HFJ05_00540 [Eubacterium sp.]|nr:hypothetical protein [Eubacterium sp.]